jgi:hypothetical protein
MWAAKLGLGAAIIVLAACWFWLFVRPSAEPHASGVKREQPAGKDASHRGNSRSLVAAPRNAGKANPAIWVGLFIVVVAGGIGLIISLRFLRNYQLENVYDEQSLLKNFRELHKQGKLSYEEFREVQIRLMEQMQKPDGDENMR